MANNKQQTTNKTERKKKLKGSPSTPDKIFHQIKALTGKAIDNLRKSVRQFAD